MADGALIANQIWYIGGLAPNHRLDRTSGTISFGEVGAWSMSWIKCFLSALSTAPLAGQLDR
jgi:hypothetical protein